MLFLGQSPDGVWGTLQKDLIVQNEVYRVMAVDALASSHPLSSPADEVNTPAQISELFDSITYSKVLPGFLEALRDKGCGERYIPQRASAQLLLWGCWSLVASLAS